MPFKYHIYYQTLTNKIYTLSKLQNMNINQKFIVILGHDTPRKTTRNNRLLYNPPPKGRKISSSILYNIQRKAIY